MSIFFFICQENTKKKIENKLTTKGKPKQLTGVSNNDKYITLFLYCIESSSYFNM